MSARRNGDDLMNPEHPQPQLPRLSPNASWEELARLYGSLAAGLYEQIPEIARSVERIEAAVLVSDGAAHRAEAASQRAVRAVEGMTHSVESVLKSVKSLREVVSVLEMRVGGAENKADEAHKSSHDLEKYLAQAAAETGRILDKRAKDPNDRLDSERARAIAEDVVKKAREAAAIGQKVDAYDKIQKAKQDRWERIKKLAWKGIGAALVAIGGIVGASLYGQCQRAAGRMEILQQQVVPPPGPPTSPAAIATASAIVAAPVQAATSPAAAGAPDAGKRR